MIAKGRESSPDELRKGWDDDFAKARALNAFNRLYALGYSLRPLSQIQAPAAGKPLRRQRTQEYFAEHDTTRNWESRLGRYLQRKHLLHRYGVKRRRSRTNSTCRQSPETSEEGLMYYSEDDLSVRSGTTTSEGHESLDLTSSPDTLIRLAFTRFHNVQEASASMAFLGDRLSFHYKNVYPYMSCFAKELFDEEESERAPCGAEFGVAGPEEDGYCIGYDLQSPSALIDAQEEAEAYVGGSGTCAGYNVLPAPPIRSKDFRWVGNWVSPSLSLELLRLVPPERVPVGLGVACLNSATFDPFKTYLIAGAWIAAVAPYNEPLRWSPRTLILRQNFLYEFTCGASLAGATAGGRPVGCAALCGATVSRYGRLVVRVDALTSADANAIPHSFLVHADDEEAADAWEGLLAEAAGLALEAVYKLQGSDRASEGSWRKLCNATLGQGRTAYVKVASRVGSGTQCALKLFDKEEMIKCVEQGIERADALFRETLVSLNLTAAAESPSCPIVRVLGVLEVADTFVLEMELMSNHNLFHLLSDMGSLPEPVAAKVVRRLLECVAFCQFNHIAHRDIKLSNILCSTHPEDDDSPDGWVDGLKVCDFGMGEVESPPGMLCGRCGTPGYVAPEILASEPQEPYANRVDTYSVGVVAYTLLCGYEPFFGETNRELIEQNAKGDFEFDFDGWSTVSLSAQDLVAALMEKDPDRRITPLEALEHPWLRADLEEASIPRCSSLDISKYDGKHF